MSLVHAFTMDKCSSHTHFIDNQITHFLCLSGNDKDSTVRVLRLEHLHDELRRDIDRHSLRLVSAGLELLFDYCVRFYERQFACSTDIDGEYMENLDNTLSQYFSLCGQKSVEGGISKVESALSSLSPAYLNDFVRAETGKMLAEYIRIRMMEYIKKRVHKEGCPLEQVAGEFGFYQPRLLALLYRQVFGCQPEHYLLTPDYKLN